MGSNEFHETQQFRSKTSWFAYLLFLSFIILMLYAVVKQVIFKIPFGSKPTTDTALIITTIFVTVFSGSLFLLIYTAKLKTIINGEGVFYKWSPFRKNYKLFYWKEIESATVIDYGFVGFGIHFSKYGVVHNTAGHKGLQLILKSGKKIVIGTQHPDEVANFVKAKTNKNIV